MSDSPENVVVLPASLKSQQQLSVQKDMQRRNDIKGDVAAFHNQFLQCFGGAANFGAAVYRNLQRLQDEEKHEEVAKFHTKYMSFMAKMATQPVVTKAEVSLEDVLEAKRNLEQQIRHELQQNMLDEEESLDDDDNS